MRIFIIALLIFLPMSASALVIDTPLADAAEEQRARALFHEFRCVVCQSESVADSPADVARDVRAKVRALVHEGKSDAEVKHLLVESYGEFILMQPEFSEQNIWLWFMPLLLLLLGSGMLLRQFKKP